MSKPRKLKQQEKDNQSGPVTPRVAPATPSPQHSGQSQNNGEINCSERIQAFTKDWEACIQVILLVLTLIVLMKQCNIEENTNPPYEPTLRITEGEPKPISLSVGEACEDRSMKEITFYVKNIGQTPTGRVSIRWDSESIDWSNGTETVNIGNIPPLMINETRLSLRAKHCSLNSSDCTKGCVAPRGNTKLRLLITCDFCKEKQRQFDYPVRICIWENSSVECDN